MNGEMPDSNLEMPDSMPRQMPEAAVALGDPVAIEMLDEILAEQSAVEGGSPHGHSAVALARGEMGTRDGSKYQQYFGYGDVAWCALFVSWAVDMTGNRDHKVLWGNPAWVESVHAWAQRERRLVSKPEHGDIFGLGGQHTGMVAGADPSGSTIYTIEGNYSDSVTARTMSAGSLWFARLPD